MFCLPKVRMPLLLYSSVILIYLLTARQVPGCPYSVGYLGNELPDNSSPRHDSTAAEIQHSLYEYLTTPKWTKITENVLHSLVSLWLLLLRAKLVSNATLPFACIYFNKLYVSGVIITICLHIF